MVEEKLSISTAFGQKRRHIKNHTPSILLSIKAERFFNAGVYGVLND